MKLEDLRQNDLGTVSIWLPHLGNDANSYSRLTYPTFTQLAFYQTIQQLEQLEFSSAQIQQGNAIQASIGSWFISIEAYINSILRLGCLVTGKSFDEFRKKDFDARIAALFNILNIERTPFYKTSFSRLREFMQYRNELFHDRTYENPLGFTKTSFSGNPMYANQVDAMQAATIALEVYEAFRYVVPTLDLMPQIRMPKNDSFFFMQINELYDLLLRPYFENILAKHSLTSSIVLDIDSPHLDISPIFQGIKFESIIKAIPDSKFAYSASVQSTNIGKTLFDKIKDAVEFDTSLYFRVACYLRS